MDGLESTMLSEITQTEKDKYCMVSLTCEIKKKWEGPSPSNAGGTSLIPALGTS